MARIAFIQKEAHEKLGVMMLSAVLKRQGHDTRVFIADLEEDFLKAVLDFDPLVAAFSVYFGEHGFALRTFQALKERNPRLTTVAGGPFFMIDRAAFDNEHVDIVIAGDGEEALPEVIRCIEKGCHPAGISGVSYRDAGRTVSRDDFCVTPKLEGLPSHDRDLYPSTYREIAKQPTKYFIRSRLCPFQCTFCGNAYLARKYKEQGGNGFRIDRNYGKLFDEIRYARDSYRLDWVMFVDATFNAVKEEAKAFLRAYATANLPPFLCNLRIEKVDDELVDLLEAAGCERVTIGLQSAVPGIQAIAGRPTRNDRALTIVRMIRGRGIRVGVDMIIGWPGESWRDVWDSIELVRDLAPDYVNTNLLVLFPHTEISSYAYENGFIGKLPTVEDFAGFMKMKAGSSARLPVSHEVQNLERLFAFAVYHPRFEQTVKVLARSNAHRLIGMIHDYPYLLRSFRYDALSASEKIRKLLDFVGAR